VLRSVLSSAVAVAGVALVASQPASALPHVGVSVMSAPKAAGVSATALVRPDDKRLDYVGHWALSQAAATTVNTGSRLLFTFVGTRLIAHVDVTDVLLKPQVYVTIDGRSHLVTLTQPVIALAATLPNRLHTVAIDVKSLDAGGARWARPLTTAVNLTALDLGPGGHLMARPRSASLHFEFYGDSITEGIKALGPDYSMADADATRSFATLVSRAFRADDAELGFAGQGVINPGLGGVGAASNSFGHVLAAQAAQGSPPDAVVVNFGENDTQASAQEFTDAYRAYLRQIRAAYPKTWIFAVHSLNGDHAQDITAAVRPLSDRKIVDVDTSGWIPPASTYDGQHPTAWGHRQVAARLIAVIKAKTGWTPTTLHP